MFNPYTLQIRDKNLAQEYAEQRTIEFNRLLWPQVCVFGILFVLFWLKHCFFDTALAPAIWATVTFVTVLAQLAFRLLCNRLSVYTAVPSLLCMQLSLLQTCEGFLNDGEPYFRFIIFEFAQLLIVIFFCLTNYMTFLETLLTLPVPAVATCLIQLKVNNGLEDRLSDSERQKLFWILIVAKVCLASLACA